MIILGVVVAVWLGERRWAARGGTPGTVVDVAVWAVPFGLVGGRLYHVITDNQLYFGSGRHPIDALKVWNGGLGIWGAIAFGALGAYLGCRRRGVSLRTFADAAAPGVALAQAIGRWGNWFNQELFGRPTKLPWAVEIDPAHRPLATPDAGTYHPTFLYESLWCIGVALLVIWAEKRFRLAYGRTFALYVAAYTVGRAWIEWLRVDSAHHFLGLRLNDWTALVVFLCAVAYLYLYRDRTEIPEGALGVPAESAETAVDQDAAGDEGATGENDAPGDDAPDDGPSGKSPGDSETAETTAPAGAEDATAGADEPGAQEGDAETGETGETDKAPDPTDAADPRAEEEAGETQDTGAAQETADAEEAAGTPDSDGSDPSAETDGREKAVTAKDPAEGRR
jgi:prolipoprotein diacylglyceryl transferase